MNNQSMPQSQRGFVLPVGMIMLGILTVIGIAAMKDGALQERMSSNYVDKEKSFQSAENGLRVVQRLSLRTSYQNISLTNSFNSTVDNPSGAPDYNTLDWSSAGWVVSQATATHVASPPKAMLEEMHNSESLKTGKEPKNKELAKRYYRVTTFAVGETNSSETTLQGVVVVD